MVDPYAIWENRREEPLSKAAPPGTPEIVNPQNPSQPSWVCLGALISGFQHIVQQSGLDKSGQSPVQDPSNVTESNCSAAGCSAASCGLTDKQFAETAGRNDPDHQLDLSMRLAFGMERYLYKVH